MACRLFGTMPLHEPAVTCLPTVRIRSMVLGEKCFHWTSPFQNVIYKMSAILLRPLRIPVSETTSYFEKCFPVRIIGIIFTEPRLKYTTVLEYRIPDFENLSKVLLDNYVWYPLSVSCYAWTIKVQSLQYCVSKWSWLFLNAFFFKTEVVYLSQVTPNKIFHVDKVTNTASDWLAAQTQTTQKYSVLINFFPW